MISQTKMNKKIISIALIIFFSFTLFAAPIKIMSFNLNGNDGKHRFESNEQWSKTITAILKQSKADIILLQEISLDLEKILGDSEGRKKAKEDNLKRLCSELTGFSGNWKYETSANYMLRKDIKIGNINYAAGSKTQNNAILYNSSKFSVKDLSSELRFNNFTNAKCKFQKNSVQVLKFTELETKEEFIVINVHLASNNNPDKLNRDVDTLEKLYASYKLKYPVIVGGDFNTPRTDLLHRNFDNVDGNSSWYLNNKGLKTSLGKNKSTISFANDFDHFIYNNKIKEISVMKRINIDSDKDTIHNVKIGNHTFEDSTEFTQYVSDHYPIIFEYEIGN